jgi:hypothetical protein
LTSLIAATIGERFYVCLEDPNAALLAISQYLKIGYGDRIQVSRRLSKRHAKFLMLKTERCEQYELPRGTNLSLAV